MAHFFKFFLLNLSLKAQQVSFTEILSFKILDAVVFMDISSFQAPYQLKNEFGFEAGWLKASLRQNACLNFLAGRELENWDLIMKCKKAQKFNLAKLISQYKIL